ncbi:phage tail tube protein [Streptomyces scabiei]|uniref:phage tail tube protein n=1 Tax=Streptomyces scabiei TaxID=1930 RepID=UPI0029A3B5F4|nr:phage tail tube protein [Streptomyces scabiei]MDX2566090.1 phage tail tube protein [Streptomyces scabiei]MDX3149630.1 phage tail tube protein [Streptomyces scabiei]MDX3161395.1 phage tail tube protein [Streptomyces scabiei]MDX3161407.1 phage tail tube protein [Streptomyces scabiei]MDX3288130.1 phage tail tube protein [Streptomyces scabiei]
MAGLDAFGTQLQRGDGATPEVFTPLANVTDITPPGIERETYDVTAHDSEDAWREFIGGLKDGGEVELDLNYDPREHDSLLADFADAVPRSYKVVWPGTLGNWAFKAIITNFEPEAPHDDKLAASVTYKVSGKPTITTGS